MRAAGAVIFGLLLGLTVTAASAAGDLATRAKLLPELTFGTKSDDYAVSQKDFELETGKSYRLKLTRVGFKEYGFMAPELFHDIWIRQIVINGLEVHPMGSLYKLEFDDEGTIELQFVTIRPGSFEWYIEGLKDKGMTGKFVVK
ncbi:MAG: hypothetical protein GC191_07115 [Azospirillum sp.]|nr:hypothetical protein [Azospirillum sp.]